MRPEKQALDFIVIGAQKAGTTSLFEYLRGHPELALPAHKEAPYFSHDTILARGWEEYLQRTFASADPARRWGTITTHYMAGGLYEAAGASAGDELTVPLRIRERLPQARLVAILRDPVERARSHHRMSVLNGRESRSFEQAVGELIEPAALAASRRRPSETGSYLTWGEYGRILRGYLEVFPREQMLVLFTDELSAQPGPTVERLLSFLGVEVRLPPNLGQRYRQGSSSRRLSWLDLHSAQAALARSRPARSAWHALPAAARRRADRELARASYRLEAWNRRRGEVAADPERATPEGLREHYRADGSLLAELLGATPPWSGADRAS